MVAAVIGGVVLKAIAQVRPQPEFKPIAGEPDALDAANGEVDCLGPAGPVPSLIRRSQLRYA